MAADTSGYAIGGIIGQCTKDGGKLRVLGYYSAHLSACQQRYHPFEQEFLGLLYTSRDMIKHLGRIPAIILSYIRITPTSREWKAYLWKEWSLSISDGTASCDKEVREYCTARESARRTRRLTASRDIPKGEIG